MPTLISEVAGHAGYGDRDTFREHSTKRTSVKKRWMPTGPKTPDDFKYTIFYRFIVLIVCTAFAGSMFAAILIWFGDGPIVLTAGFSFLFICTLPALFVAEGARRAVLGKLSIESRSRSQSTEVSDTPPIIAELQGLDLDAPSSYSRNRNALHFGSRAVRVRGFYVSFAKRCIDLFIIFCALPILLPLCLAIFFLIYFDGGSPLYRQNCIGRRGKPFVRLKFRTMRKNADAILESLLNENPAARSDWEHHQYLRHDPRVTSLGKLLRKFNLDEFPQLWNVLKGEMTLVGPRPMRVSQARLYPGLSYYALRPGITGLWQCSARHASAFSDRAIYDDAYLTHVSFGMDISIMLRTVFVWPWKL